jgi:hypothetical protein
MLIVQQECPTWPFRQGCHLLGVSRSGCLRIHRRVYTKTTWNDVTRLHVVYSRSG